MEQVVGTSPEIRHGDVWRQARSSRNLEPGDRRTHRWPALNFIVRGVEGRSFEAGEHPVVALGVVARTVVDRS